MSIMRYFRIAVAVVLLGGLSRTSAEAAHPVRRQPTLEEQAEYLGNEGYYQAHGGNPHDYVVALFADVLDRTPSEAEIQRWSERFLNCAYGPTLAREFLIFARSELAARERDCPPPHTGPACPAPQHPDRCR